MIRKRQISILLIFLCAQTFLDAQIDNYKIEFPWAHSASRMAQDDSGYYWLHDNHDFYYYNGHQIIPTKLPEILNRRKNSFYFSGDLVMKDGSFLLAVEEDLFLFDPQSKELRTIMTLPDGVWFQHLYKDDLGDVWLFVTNTKNNSRPVYRSSDGLKYSLAFDLSDHIGDQSLDYNFELTDRNGLLFFHRRLGGLTIIDSNGYEVQAPVQDYDSYLETRQCSQFRLDNQNRLWRIYNCLLYTSPSPRDATLSRMPSSA